MCYVPTERQNCSWFSAFSSFKNFMNANNDDWFFRIAERSICRAYKKDNVRSTAVTWDPWRFTTLLILVYCSGLTDWDGVWWHVTKLLRNSTSSPDLFSNVLLGSGLKPSSMNRLIVSGSANRSNNGWSTAPDNISATRLNDALNKKGFIYCIWNQPNMTIF